MDTLYPWATLLHTNSQAARFKNIPPHERTNQTDMKNLEYCKTMPNILMRLDVFQDLDLKDMLMFN